MGKGKILSHLGNGKYSVQVEYNTEKLDNLIKKLTEKRDTIELTELPDLKQKKDDLKDLLDTAKADLNAAIKDYTDSSDDSGTKKKVDDVHQAYLYVLSEYQKVVMNINDKEMELKSLERRVTFLETNRPDNEVKEMWCADLSTDLSGEVGTVEILGVNQHVQIRPGHDGAADFDPSRDGQIYPSVALPPAGSFYNLAMVPGCQKWRPQYRKGTINSMDRENNTCSIDLDPEKSNVANLPVNARSSIDNVPIKYMTCDSLAFSEGDRALIEFENHDWNNSKVIGFVEGPKPCSRYIKIKINGFECSMKHIVGLFDTYTWKNLKTLETDAKGIFQIPPDLSLDVDFSRIKVCLFRLNEQDYLFSHFLRGEDPPGDLGSYMGWMRIGYRRVKRQNAWFPDDWHYELDSAGVDGPDDTLPLYDFSNVEVEGYGGHENTSDPFYISCFNWKPYNNKTVAELSVESQEMITASGEGVVGSIIDFDNCKVHHVSTEQLIDATVGIDRETGEDTLLDDPDFAYSYDYNYFLKFPIPAQDSHYHYVFNNSYNEDGELTGFYKREIYLEADTNQNFVPDDIYPFVDRHNTEPPLDINFTLNINGWYKSWRDSQDPLDTGWYKPWSLVHVQLVDTPEKFI